MRRFSQQELVVLVVEDDPDVLRMLEVAFAHYGFKVHGASSGQEAIGLYQQHHKSISVVLLDVQMQGMNGPQTLVALQSIEPTVRCCFMSGDTGTYSIGQLLTLGAAYVFDKPFHLAEMVRLLAEVAGFDNTERGAPKQE